MSKEEAKKAAIENLKDTAVIVNDISIKEPEKEVEKSPKEEAKVEEPVVETEKTEEPALEATEEAKEKVAVPSIEVPEINIPAPSLDVPDAPVSIPNLQSPVLNNDALVNNEPVVDNPMPSQSPVDNFKNDFSLDESELVKVDQTVVTHEDRENAKKAFMNAVESAYDKIPNKNLALAVDLLREMDKLLGIIDENGYVTGKDHDEIKAIRNKYRGLQEKQNDEVTKVNVNEEVPSYNEPAIPNEYPSFSDNSVDSGMNYPLM